MIGENTGPARKRRTTRVRKLSLWVKGKPRRGAAFEYHRGFLARNRSADVYPRHPEIEDIRSVAAEAAKLMSEGGFVLLQKRHGKEDYSYIVEKV